jgi:BarA-like signal transduction histidine kinase
LILLENPILQIVVDTETPVTAQDNQLKDADRLEQVVASYPSDPTIEADGQEFTSTAQKSILQRANGRRLLPHANKP